MRTIKTRQQRRSLRALTTCLALALLAALLLAGNAQAVTKPGMPTAKTPKGSVAQAKPIFSWSKAKGAARYELRVYNGKKQLLKKTGITKLSWKSSKALPKNVGLAWKVRASNASGNGAWSKSLAFRVALAIGDPYQGGKVAYIDGTGQHGLIAATADQDGGAGIMWATEPYWLISVPGGTGTAIGTGPANTDKIIAQNGAGSTYAAGLARAYAGGGYHDWYLPSMDELNTLYLGRVAIGGLASTYYLSSSEFDPDPAYAWAQLFESGARSGEQSWGDKYRAMRVRAVRSF